MRVQVHEFGKKHPNKDERLKREREIRMGSEEGGGENVNTGFWRPVSHRDLGGCE